MAEDEYAQALNALGQGMREISTVVNNQGKEIEHLRKPKEDELPWYLARTPKAMQDQLEKMGWFTKEQPGLQDDFDNTFRMFTQVSEKGDLVPGLTGAHGPASLIELYQTMDLRGLLWNYGVGWVSALKGGWNSAIGAKRKEAEDFINDLRKRRMESDLRPESEKLKEFLDYTKTCEELFNRYYNSGNIEESNKSSSPEHKATFYKWKKGKDGKSRKYKVGEIVSTSLLDTYNWPQSDFRGGDNRSTSSRISVSPVKIDGITVERTVKKEREKYHVS